MSLKPQDEEQALINSASDKKNVTYFLSVEVLEAFNKIVPAKKRGPMVEVLLKQFIQRHAAIPISRVPKRLAEGDED